MTTGARGARTADDWVERVRDASDIVELVGETVQLKRVGRNWVGLCPFHKEKTPSFSVNGERGFYHCFSCKAGGDVFKFVQESERIGFLEAVELLSRRAGIPVPDRGVGRSTRTPLLDALEQAAVAYEQWLADPVRGVAARDYLESRGLARETVRAFRLGLAPEGWDNLVGRLRGRIGEETLVNAGLAARRDTGRGLYDRFRHRLMVPLVAVGGAVVGFAARALGDEPPKYLNSPETPVYHKGSFLFALEQARRAVTPEGEMVLVEGQFDAIALHQAGLTNVAATSGTALTADQAKMLHRLVPRVALTYDGDDAGREAMMRSLGVLMGEGLDVVVVELPPGEDPDTLVRSRGVAGWDEARAAALDPIAFVQRHVLRKASGTADADPRERALQAVVTLAGQVRDPIRVRLLLERAAEVFGLSARVLARAVSLKGKPAVDAAAPLRAAVREERRGDEALERRLLAALLVAPEALEATKSRLSPEDFRDQASGALALWLWGGAAGLPDEEPAAGLARELIARSDAALDWAAEAEGATRRMMERRLKQELRDRRNRLSHAAGGPEAERLMHEIDELARSLRELSA